MGRLEDFKAKAFPDQVGILNQITKNNETEYLSELFTLYQELTGDKTLDTMIEHTLRDMLMANEAETVKKLTGGTDKEKLLCLQIAGNKQFASAVEPIIRLVKSDPEIGMLTTAFIAMSELKAPEFLDIFREYLHHDNEIISAICIEMMGSYHDHSSIRDLEEIINRSEADKHYESCSVGTADAIESMGQLDNDESIQFLASKVHHRNPAARRQIQEELIRIGERTLPFLEKVFAQGTPNQRIIIAGIISRIGAQAGGEILVKAIRNKQINNKNVKLAVYEAFETIHFDDARECLLDLLTETDPQLLMTAISALNQQTTEQVVDGLRHYLCLSDFPKTQLIDAIIHTKSLTLFQHLYQCENIRRQLVDAILESQDNELRYDFCKTLEMMGLPEAEGDIKVLKKQADNHPDRHILVVEDSNAGRYYYRSIISDMGIEPITAENGRAALDIIESGDTTFDLIVTDMNMPVMDGIEFVSRVRAMIHLTAIPIIMCTTETHQSQVKLAEKKGVNAFIAKPIQAPLLKEKIITLLK